MPDQPIEAAAPAETPDIDPVTPKLVPYPGLEVSYVANGDGDVYHLRGVFYTYFNGNWYFAKTMRGPWTYIQMKYVPSDIFRVRGHLPPSLQGTRTRTRLLNIGG